MNWIKIVGINIFVLIGLLFLIEASYRLAWTVKVCYSAKCDFSRLVKLKIPKGFTDKNIGLSTYHELVGYIPTPGFTFRITANGWEDELLTIDQDGFRATGNNKKDISDKSIILTIGDSFTFGDQVSDTETWPSCIELRTKRRTLNAGVFGYGTAQAVKRASILTQDRNVDTVILSILINDNFNRDRLRFRNGFPRPAVIQTGNGLTFAKVPPIDSKNTKWKPNYQRFDFFGASNYSYILNKVLYWLGFEPTGMGHTEKHEYAAEIDQIIEFSVKEFSDLNVQNKLIVLQYAANDFPRLTSEVERVKKLLLSEAKLVDIRVIDTYNRLQVESTDSGKIIWHGHHTAYGNQIVCDEIFHGIKNLR